MLVDVVGLVGAVSTGRPKFGSQISKSALATGHTACGSCGVDHNYAFSRNSARQSDRVLSDSCEALRGWLSTGIKYQVCFLFMHTPAQ